MSAETYYYINVHMTGLSMVLNKHVIVLYLYIPMFHDSYTGKSLHEQYK